MSVLKKKGAEHTEIIVKRRSKKGHDDEHGGAWKVAFADFTMAMMALFMVLWIVNPRNEMKSPASGEMESNPLVDGGAGVFDGTSRSPLELDGVPVRPNRDELAAEDEDSAEAGEDGEQRRRYVTHADMQELASLMQSLAVELDASANLEVDVVPQGLRILLKDDQNRFMFQRGSAALDEHFRSLLAGLAKVLAKVDNKLIISGHTDAVPYRGKAGYNNWNLSGDRALRARNVLVEEGLPASGVLQVTAQADVMPLRPEAPEDGANRRVEVLVLTDQAVALYRQLFGEDQVRASVGGSGAHLQAPREG